MKRALRDIRKAFFYFNSVAVTPDFCPVFFKRAAFFVNSGSFSHLNLKKLASILLLLVFLFNIVGYNLVFWTMQNQARHTLLKRFDNHQYSEHELVVLTIPLNLPYPVESKEFERNDTEFEYQNQTYRLVERKFENDTMFIVCIKDYESKLIAQKLMDYVNLSNDLSSGTKEALSFLGKIYKDYTTTEIPIASAVSVTEAPSYISMQESSLPERDLPVDSPPPDLLF